MGLSLRITHYARWVLPIDVTKSGRRIRFDDPPAVFALDNPSADDSK
jgi:hypothetical protein